jgi:hypothetical protein
MTLSPVELLKITPESRTFQNIIYEPRVWGGRGSFSVAFLKFSYIMLKIVPIDGIGLKPATHTQGRM